MKRKQNIFLVGPMGAGKTTIGRALATHLQYKFYDSDHVVEKRAGADIMWIFDLEGEEGFRKREQEVIDELTQQQKIVLSTGGGTVLSSENRNVLAARGIVIYLRATLEQQLTRMEKDRKRPMLQAVDKEKVLKRLNQEREPLYMEIADYIFDTDTGSVKAVVSEILRALDT